MTKKRVNIRIKQSAALARRSSSKSKPVKEIPSNAAVIKIKPKKK